MANSILTSSPLSCNEISELAQFFELTFDAYLEPSSPFYPDYLCNLRTLVGLGFTAALADWDLLSIYQQHLQPFLTYGQGNFREHIEVKDFIAQSIAEMVAIALRSFSALRYPSYYQAFNKALRYTLKRLALKSPQQVDSLFARLKIT